jgi:hypothetical protein
MYTEVWRLPGLVYVLWRNMLMQLGVGSMAGWWQQATLAPASHSGLLPVLRI